MLYNQSINTELFHISNIEQYGMSLHSAQYDGYTRVTANPPSPTTKPSDIFRLEHQSVAKEATREHFKLLECLAVVIT